MTSLRGFGHRRRWIVAALGAVAMLAVGAVAVSAAPFNDLRESAGKFPVNTSRVMGSNKGATLEHGEATPCAEMGSTVWYKVYLPAGVGLELDTKGSDYDTALAVYSDILTNTVIDCNDDISDDDLSSMVEVPSSMTGRTYYIQVGGYSGYQGNFVLHYRYTR